MEENQGNQKQFESFGNMIKRGMKIKGYTRESLAQQLADRRNWVDEGIVRKWENETEYPDTEMMQKIAETLGLDYQELYYAKQRQQNQTFNSVENRYVKGMPKRRSILFNWITRGIEIIICLVLLYFVFKYLLK